jgi:bifunctional DNA-binding transcriptional regulator/antitoxin component of YhaV-PrlF toxin-antitoxin module
MQVVRKITQSGRYSKVLNLPKDFLKSLNWKEKQKVIITLDDKKGRLIVEDYKNP